MKSRTDAELIRLATGGDSEAFTELVRRYRDAVYGYCYYRTGNFEDARDLSQEVFILAYRKCAQVREAEKIGGWLHKIAINLCNRWLEQRRELSLEEIHLPEPASESPKVTFVREALSSLPDNERLAVVMHYVNGLSYGEIAGFLETSVGAVKGRLYRGREMLKKEVLEMTRETFGENKLDEDFVLKSVRRALDKIQKACWELKDIRTARKTADKAIEMLDKLGSRSQEAQQAEYEALMRAVHATQDLSEREALLNRAWDFGIQSSDVLVAAEALRGRAEQLIWKRDLEAAQKLLERAREVASKNKLAVQLAFCDAAESSIAFFNGDLKKTRNLLQHALDGVREAQPASRCDLTRHIAGLEAGLLALDSFPSGSTGLLLYYNKGHFRVESDKVLLQAYPGGNLLSTSDFAVSPNLPVLPNALPLFDLGWPEPDQLLALPIQIGRSWSSETRELNDWYKIDSVIKSDNESVITKLGKFDHCVQVIKRLTGPKRQGVDLERQIYGTRTIWLAPGVGVVKTVHEPEEGDTVTAELADYNITGGDGYLPLEVGNWWRYRWVECEENYGFTTQDYVGISTRHEDNTLLVQCYIICYRN